MLELPKPNTEKSAVDILDFLKEKEPGEPIEIFELQINDVTPIFLQELTKLNFEISLVIIADKQNPEDKKVFLFTGNKDDTLASPLDVLIFTEKVEGGRYIVTSYSHTHPSYNEEVDGIKVVRSLPSFPDYHTFNTSLGKHFIISPYGIVQYHGDIFIEEGRYLHDIRDLAYNFQINHPIFDGKAYHQPELDKNGMPTENELRWKLSELKARREFANKYQLVLSETPWTSSKINDIIHDIVSQY